MTESPTWDFSGKVAIVTGASRGIGEAIARDLGAAGAKVAVSSRKQAGVDAVAARAKEAGHECLAVAAHMGDSTAIAELVTRTIERFGALDIVINNAATNPVYAPLAEIEDTVFDRVMAVNAKAPWTLAKLAYPHLRKRGGGSIVNISSVAGLRPEAMLGLYSASKAALQSLTRSLAIEWGPDRIRVNAICPGLVKTEFSSLLWREESSLKDFLDKVPLGRMASPEEIAPLALFLASDASAYCTGGMYSIDGGLLA